MIDSLLTKDLDKRLKETFDSINKTLFFRVSLLILMIKTSLDQHITIDSPETIKTNALNDTRWQS